jgi:hypothetical protein
MKQQILSFEMPFPIVFSSFCNRFCSDHKNTERKRKILSENLSHKNWEDFERGGKTSSKAAYRK